MAQPTSVALEADAAVGKKTELGKVLAVSTVCLFDSLKSGKWKMRGMKINQA